MMAKQEFAFPSEYYVPEIFAERRAALGVYEAKKEATGQSPGMTLREYYAGQAVAAMVVVIADADRHGGDMRKIGETYGQALARLSFEVADAMLEARAK